MHSKSPLKMETVQCTEYHRHSGSDDSGVRITKLNGNSVIYSLEFHEPRGLSVMETMFEVIRTTFLPVGYPDSVRPEYLTYQYWDSIQGMSSYLRSVLTTRSVLAGAGVGSASSSALAAALVWVFRDGLGMFGSLVFAYRYSSTFEVYIKEWRYLADILNNVGLTLDLLCADFPSYYFAMTSISTLCKSCCGLIAGATKARISAHFARPGHLADVTAKESTQETAVALCGLLLGMVLAQVIGNYDTSVWITFLLLLAVHQYSNYHLVKVLVFANLNPQRCLILMDLTTSARSDAAVLPCPKEVATKEGFIVPIVLSYLGPKVGTSMDEIIRAVQFVVVNRSGAFPAGGGWDVRYGGAREAPASLRVKEKDAEAASIWRLNVCALYAELCQAWEGEECVVGVDMNGRVIVALQDGVSNASVCKAYLLGMYVHRQLQVNWTLCMASQEARHRYLSQLLQIIISRLAAEARAWYRSLNLPPSSTADGGLQLTKDDCWDFDDVTALSIGDFRYAPIKCKSN